MSCFDKDDYKALKEQATFDNLVFISVPPEQLCGATEYNGVTIVFTKPRDGLRMVEVAVSYCSPEDKFKRKHGKYQALASFYQGRSTHIPLGSLSIEGITEALTYMFIV